MKTISVHQAFASAPPRRPAVLCVREAEQTRLKATLWFTWLNIKHQPMLSFALERDAGLSLRTGDELTLAFPPVGQTALYQEGLCISQREENLPQGVMREADLLLPEGSQVVLRCSLSNAYNYPFKNVRIYICDLEEALGAQLEE